MLEKRWRMWCSWLRLMQDSASARNWSEKGKSTVLIISCWRMQRWQRSRKASRGGDKPDSGSN